MWAVEIEKDAKSRAREMIENAKNKEKDAERHAASATEIVAAAKEEASVILGQGRLEANGLVMGRQGELAKINEAIARADKQYGSVQDEVALLENRRDDVAAEIEALRKKLG